MAQIIVAVQMVLEEKFVYKHDVHPLRAVGTEGACTLARTAEVVVDNFIVPAGQLGLQHSHKALHYRKADV